MRATQLSDHTLKIMNHNAAVRSNNVAVYFACVGACVTLYLIMVQRSNPLFSWATWDIEWVNAWLWMSVLDYYCCCACLSAIVAHSEAKWSHVLAWITGFCVFGSPVCCAYIVYRCVYHKGLMLESSSFSVGGGLAREESGGSSRYLQVASADA